MLLFQDYTTFDTQNVNYLPMTALIAFVVLFNLGMGTIPVLILGEIFPLSVKGFALCLADIYFGAIVIVISKAFQMLKDEFGMFVPFMAFAVCCGFGLIFIIKCVPETTGKSLEEIQLELRGNDEAKDMESKVKPKTEVNVISVTGIGVGAFTDVPLDSYKPFASEFQVTKF